MLRRRAFTLLVSSSIRCCADTVVTAVCAAPCTSASSCEELGWGGGGADHVCGESDIPGCMTDQNFQQAFDLCVGVGARLCSLDELGGAETSGSGCGFDNTRVWSSSLCSGGHMSAAGNPNSWGTHAPECASDLAHTIWLRLSPC